MQPTREPLGAFIELEQTIAIVVVHGIVECNKVARSGRHAVCSMHGASTRVDEHCRPNDGKLCVAHPPKVLCVRCARLACDAGWRQMNCFCTPTTAPGKKPRHACPGIRSVVFECHAEWDVILDECHHSSTRRCSHAVGRRIHLRLYATGSATERNSTCLMNRTRRRRSSQTRRGPWGRIPDSCESEWQVGRDRRCRRTSSLLGSSCWG